MLIGEGGDAQPGRKLQDYLNIFIELKEFMGYNRRQDRFAYVSYQFAAASSRRVYRGYQSLRKG